MCHACRLITDHRVVGGCSSMSHACICGCWCQCRCGCLYVCVRARFDTAAALALVAIRAGADFGDTAGKGRGVCAPVLCLARGDCSTASASPESSSWSDAGAIGLTAMPETTAGAHARNEGDRGYASITTAGARNAFKHLRSRGSALDA